MNLTKRRGSLNIEKIKKSIKYRGIPAFKSIKAHFSRDIIIFLLKALNIKRLHFGWGSFLD